MADTTRGTTWSITLNNPTQDDEDRMELARQKGWKIDGQLEVGAEGTPHYQLILKTPQVRFSAVKKAFPRAHIQLARNPAALEAYVHKADTRAGDLPQKTELYPSQKRFFELVWEVILADSEDSSEFRRSKNNRLDSPRNALFKATSALIRRGYVVEGIAVNPMTLATWVQFHNALLDRFQLGETKSQTDTRVQIPAINVAPEEHNHAPSISQPPRRRVKAYLPEA